MQTIFTNHGKVIQPQTELPVYDSVDVVVAGGGVSGLGAAIAAARMGANTLLVENNGFLGGVATANIMQSICNCKFADGIMLEILERMYVLGGAGKWDYEDRLAKIEDSFVNETTTFDPECFKEAALEMCLEANVKLLPYTRACDVIMDNGAVRGVIIENKSGRQAILAKNTVDCTGDGDISVRAGASYVFGREEDNKTRPFVLMFRIGGLDAKKILGYLEDNPDQWQPQYKVNSIQSVGGEPVATRVSGFYDLVDEAKANGDLYDWIYYLRFEAMFINRGTALCNTSRIYGLDGTNADDLREGEITGRRQMRKIINFMRKYVPGCENAYVVDTAPQLGVRETRRIVGEYFLTNDDIYSGKTFDDCIMTVEKKLPVSESRDLIDVHTPDPGEGGRDDLYERDIKSAPMVLHKYEMCYRMLLAKGIDNLLFAGRLMSTTHMVEAFTRSMPFCMRLGQVAGTAAALSAIGGISPKELSFKKLKDALSAAGYVKF